MSDDPKWLKTFGFLYWIGYTYIPNMRSVQASLFDISCLQGFHNTMWHTYIPNMRSVQASLVETSCLHGFHNLTPVDPKWPLTSTKNNRLCVLNVAQLHTKYEICTSFPCWDIVFTRFSQFDPCWPQLTFDLQKNRLLVLNVVHLHTTYEICPSFAAWDIVFTRFS